MLATAKSSVNCPTSHTKVPQMRHQELVVFPFCRCSTVRYKLKFCDCISAAVASEERCSKHTEKVELLMRHRQELCCTPSTMLRVILPEENIAG